MAFERGSTWRKWDLHVHSPASHTAQYGAGEAAWTAFLDDLAGLGPEVSVIGINDYMWIDGYERVLAEHASGRLPKLEAIFPVIELRLDDFIGTTSHLSRLNAHVIFAPGTDPELIRHQFIARLFTSFKLTDRYQQLQTKWSAVPTREAFAELGRHIKSTVPASELHRYHSDFIEGFNNWVIPLREVLTARSESSLPEVPLIGLGKTEWEDIPWNDNTVAAKKNLISSVDLLFAASASAKAATVATDKLRAAQVNYRLLDCSDAHDLSTSLVKDRVGNCFTWICADPTLAGLKHALLEYRSRVHIGEMPLLLARQEADPTNFVSRVQIAPVDDGHAPAPTFAVDIPVNAGFVAIIGNKGSGKSALLDSIALASNAHSEPQFSFLHEKRFRNPRNNKAPFYQVTLETADGEATGPILLSSSVDRDAMERIRYLPQSLLESLCNKEPGSPDDAFEQELRSIIFSHVPEHQRLGASSLDELLHRRGEALDREIEHRRSLLSDLNRSIADLEEQSRPSRRRALGASLRAINQQIQSHDSARPTDPVPPAPPAGGAADEITEVARVQNEIVHAEEREAALEHEYSTQRTTLDTTVNLLREFDVLRSSFDNFIERTVRLGQAISLDVSQLVQLSIDRDPVEAARAAAADRLEILDAALGDGGEVRATKVALADELATIEATLDAPRRRFEQERRALEAWRQAREKLVGSPTHEGTQEYFISQLADLELIPDRITALRDERFLASHKIHDLLLQKVEMYRELYGPVQAFLQANQLAREKFSLEFETQLEIGDFVTTFLGYIDRGAVGTFYGVQASDRRVAERVKAVFPGEWDSLKMFLADHDLDLRFDRRTATPGTPLDSSSDVLRKGARAANVYDYLFGLSYLQAEYELRSDGRPISELSPGQKGTILLMFYLLVDTSGRPIALDQPDENLDNHTVHTLLRPAIRSAKRGRQVFVVTHSPNLAIVGDADQVIVASSDGAAFGYRSGSIENPKIRDFVLDVLEGTWPAFSDRERKYSTTAFNRTSSELD